MPEQPKLYDIKNMILENEPRSNYKYYIEATLYETQLTVHEIVDYTYGRDFEIYMYPYRMLKCIIPPQQYYNILSQVTPDKPYIPVYIRIMISYETEKGEITESVFTEGKFLGLLDKTKVNNSIIEEKAQRSHDYALDSAFLLRIALFDEADLNLCKEGIVSGNFGNGKNIKQLIEHGFDVCKGKNKVKIAIAEPDNKNPINGCIISGAGFLDFLEYLDTEYGIYTSRYNIFVEDNICYILNTEKNDTGMNKLYEGEADDKIYIQVFSPEDKPINFYGVETTEGHCRYILFQNNLIEEDLAVTNIMRPVEYTINSGGQIESSEVSKIKLETLTPTVKVNHGRTRGVTKANRNPKFLATIMVDDLPIQVRPYTIVRYISDAREGDCMISSIVQVFSKDACVTHMKIKSYDEFMKYAVKPPQTGKNLNN